MFCATYIWEKGVCLRWRLLRTSVFFKGLCKVHFRGLMLAFLAFCANNLDMFRDSILHRHFTSVSCLILELLGSVGVLAFMYKVF